jgi:hypothetical protein
MTLRALMRRPASASRRRISFSAGPEGSRVRFRLTSSSRDSYVFRELQPRQDDEAERDLPASEAETENRHKPHGVTTVSRAVAAIPQRN